MAGLFLVGRPLAAAIFEDGVFTAADTHATSITLCFYAIGLTGFFSQQILTRAFYSMKDSRTPMRSALIAVCVNVVLNLTLIWSMGVSGLALSTAICSYLQVAILVWALRRRIGHSFMRGLPLTVLKTVIATALMSAVSGGLLYAMRDLPKGEAGLKFDILRLGAVVLSSIAIYYYSSVLMKNDGLSLITRRKKG
jgi:putative peptidoglycan lipid II flippase